MIDPNLNKYLLSGCAVLSAQSYSPHVTRTSDGSFIFSRRESGEIVVLTDDQTVMNTLSKEDARQLALWILQNHE
jgi:hypothetical protein